MNNEKYLSRRLQKRIYGFRDILLEAYNSLSGESINAENFGAFEIDYILTEAMIKEDERLGTIALDYIMIQDKATKAAGHRNRCAIGA